MHYMYQLNGENNNRKIISSFHPAPEEVGESTSSTVDGHGVLRRHFGLIMGKNEWHQVADRLIKAGVKFINEPYVRFKGAVGEQATMFFNGPAGNSVEFKAFKNIDQLFAK